MIVVRFVFQAKFGKAGEVVEGFKRGRRDDAPHSGFKH